NCVDLDAVIIGDRAELLAARFGHIERIAMRPLSVDFHALIPEFVGSFDHLLDCQRIPAIPNASVCDAVQAKLHIGSGHGGTSQLSCPKATGSKRRAFDKATSAESMSIVSHIGDLVSIRVREPAPR